MLHRFFYEYFHIPEYDFVTLKHECFQFQMILFSWQKNIQNVKNILAQPTKFIPTTKLYSFRYFP